MAKHEFHFIIDGLDLSADQQARISTAIQNAGTAALIETASPGGGGGVAGGKAGHGVTGEAVAKAWGIGFINGKYLLVAPDRSLATAALGALKLGPEINPATIELKTSGH
jgi:hypothetical protein